MDSRARLVCVPEGKIGNGCPTLLARQIIRDVKSCLSPFVHGLDNSSLAKKLVRSWDHVHHSPQDPLCSFDADGSNHDGHQHYKLIQAVDCTFFSLLKETPYFRFLLRKTHCNADLVINECYKIYAQTRSKLKVVWKKDGKVADIMARGTVLSGSCTKTTLGNTLRVALYWKLLLEDLGYTTNWLYEEESNGTKFDCYIHVAGDDFLMFARKSVCDRIKAEYLQHFSATKDKKHHGNGQCVEAVHIRAPDDINFCSKISYPIPGEHLRICRHPLKALSLSSYHTYSAEVGYMPAEEHTFYVGYSIFHELGGTLFKMYSRMRMDKGKRTADKYLDRMRKIGKYSLGYVATKDDVDADRHLCEKLGISWAMYTSLCI